MANQPELAAFPTPDQIKEQVSTIRDFQFLKKQGIQNILPKDHPYLAQNIYNERNLAEFQLAIKIGDPSTWMEPSLNRPITEERVDYEEFGGKFHVLSDRIFNNTLHTTSINTEAEKLTILEYFHGQDKPPHIREEYQAAERNIMDEALNYATNPDRLFINTKSMVVLPFDGARIYGEQADRLELPIMTANFKRIPTDSEEMIIAIDGIETKYKGNDIDGDHEIDNAVWIDDCLATGGTALAALEMLQDKIKRFTVMVSYANVDAVKKLISRGKELGIDIQVIAAKPNDKVNEHYYLERNTTNWLNTNKLKTGQGKMPQAVGDMGAWAQPAKEVAMWGYDLLAARVKRLKEYWGDLAA